MESYEVYWRGNLIGQLEEVTVDMWYLEGTLRPAESREVTDFNVRAGNLDPGRVMKDPTTGMRAQVRSKDVEASNMIDVLVLTLDGGRLFIRQVFDTKAVQWLRENVPE